MTTDAPSQHRNHWLIAAVALIGTWAGTLGNSMMPVALPSVLHSFQVDLATGVWVISIYILLVAVLMPIFGWIGDRHGYRRTYLYGLAGYGVFCLAAPFSPSFGWLVAFRAMQAVCNATTLPAVMGIMSDVFPKDKRGSAMGFWAAINGAAHGSGPLLSGVMAQHWGWEAMFWFNGITALIGVALIAIYVPSDRRSDERPFDWLGMTLFSTAMLTFLVTLSKGGRMGWGSFNTIGLFALAAVCGTVFVWVERRHSAPFMQLQHFAKRGYATVVSIAGAQFFTLMGVQILLALYLIQLRGFTSGFSGLLIAPLAATLASISPLAGKVNDRFGPRIAMTCGMALVALAALSMLFWNLATPPTVVVFTMIATGIGMGFTQSPAAAAVTFAVPKEELGVALGIFNMTRFTSGTIGAAVMGVLLGGKASAAPSERLAEFRVGFVAVALVGLLASVLAASMPHGRSGPHGREAKREKEAE